MPFFILQSWAPQGLVPPEHMVFMSELCSNLRLNNCDVGFDVSTEPDAIESFAIGRVRAAVRQADFMFRLAWNAWGPIGNDRGMGIYSAAIRTIVSMIPNMMVTAEEAEAIKHQLGTVDAIVFDTPVDHLCTYCVPVGRRMFKTPMRRWEREPEESDEASRLGFVSKAPMSLSRIGVNTHRIVEASVQSYMLVPHSRQVLKCQPEHW